MDRDPPQFQQPARYTYRYRWRLLRWVLGEHAYVRELFVDAFPRAVQRDLEVDERIVEIPFVLQSLPPSPARRILDVGSRWSALPLYLSSLGHRVVATDLVPLRIQGSGPEMCLADCRRPPFRPETFDAIVLVSTLEHIGLGWYDEIHDSDDDLAVMRELRTLTRPGGILLLTVPFGKPGVGRRQRSYDGARLRRVTEGWTWDESRFHVRRGSAWPEASESEASREESVDETRGVALLCLRRP